MNKKYYGDDANGNPVYMHRQDPTGRFVPLEQDDANDHFWLIVFAAFLVAALVALL